MSRTRLELGRREDLGADCANCFGLCCVALAFSRSSDFPVDKPAGEPCVNLADDDSCVIHDRLRASGYRGCTVFDCFGAGQKVSMQTFAGQSWRTDAGVRSEMFAVFPVMRRLHELLWYLDCAITFTTDEAIGAALAEQFDSVRRLTAGEPAAVREIDTDVLYDGARPLLVRASAAHRGTGTGSRSDRRIRPGADLVGVDLRRADLRAADLRGALLIASDLRGVDLSHCDLLGVDLREANIGGADLSSALFLTQPQVSAAIGDAATRLPEGFDRPAHWRDPLI
jgi:hypothetical protein